MPPTLLDSSIKPPPPPRNLFHNSPVCIPFLVATLSLFNAADSSDSTMTTWQRDVTISLMHAILNAHVKDDLARQRMCHVVQMVTMHVVTVHTNRGE